MTPAAVARARAAVLDRQRDRDRDRDREQGGQSRPSRRVARARVAVLWLVGLAALWAVLIRISQESPMASDAANNALQGWDMLHGHLLLHGWIIGDATYYTFELPVYALADLIFGLRAHTTHIVAGLTYVIVAAACAAVARNRLSNTDAVARGLAAAAVLAAPLSAIDGVTLLLEKPNHTGTSAIFFIGILLIDRCIDRRVLAPVVLGILLCLGQIGDATITYVAVPAVVVVCAWRCLVARSIRTPDAAFGLAAILSVAAEKLVRHVMLELGSYTMVLPNTHFAPPHEWLHNIVLTGHAVIAVYGMHGGAVLPNILGALALAAAAFGFARVVWRWLVASPAEQILCTFIVINLAVFAISTQPNLENVREVVDILPCGAILAALALPVLRTRSATALGAAAAPGREAGQSPGQEEGGQEPAQDPELASELAQGQSQVLAQDQDRDRSNDTPREAATRARGIWKRQPRAAVVLPLLAAALLIPLGVAFTTPVAPQATAPIAAWLEAHGLHYGIAGYWQASSVTLQSGNQVGVRAVTRTRAGTYEGYAWETDAAWYKPKNYDANFIIADPTDVTGATGVADYEQAFGTPVSTADVGGMEILVYDHNLLEQVGPAVVPKGASDAL